jgi:hypothetical protein
MLTVARRRLEGLLREGLIGNTIVRFSGCFPVGAQGKSDAQMPANGQIVTAQEETPLIQRMYKMPHFGKRLRYFA